jgi:hypothetical protein
MKWMNGVQCNNAADPYLVVDRYGEPQCGEPLELPAHEPSLNRRAPLVARIAPGSHGRRAVRKTPMQYGLTTDTHRKPWCVSDVSIHTTAGTLPPVATGRTGFGGGAVAT